MKNIILLSLFILFNFVSPVEEKLNCYIFIAEECPISIYMVKPLKKAIDTYGESVTFYAVFPKSNSTKETAQRFLDTYKLDGIEILLDTDQSFSKKTGASITPEAIIINEEESILYRGRISDAYAAPGRMKHGPRNNDLVDVLNALQNGQTVKTPWKPAIGCFITFH